MMDFVARQPLSPELPARFERPGGHFLLCELDVEESIHPQHVLVFRVLSYSAYNESEYD
jgi:hypothetical protein